MKSFRVLKPSIPKVWGNQWATLRSGSSCSKLPHYPSLVSQKLSCSKFSRRLWFPLWIKSLLSGVLLNPGSEKKKKKRPLAVSHLLMPLCSSVLHILCCLFSVFSSSPVCSLTSFQSDDEWKAGRERERARDLCMPLRERERERPQLWGKKTQTQRKRRGRGVFNLPPWPLLFLLTGSELKPRHSFSFEDLCPWFSSRLNLHPDLEVELTSLLVRAVLL